MKLLTKIKLINWHYFTNVTLELGGGTLLTGDNGSGKSTIMDAVQYVLVADLRHVKFNISAHDDTNRNLLGYLRCKTGNRRGDESQTYLRSGDITSYVVLEFFDDNKQQHFLLGSVADSFADQQHFESRFFKVENCALEDGLLLEEGRIPRNIKALKRYLAPFKATIYPTVEKYREDLLVKLGSVSPRFFSLLIKALSFKPITDVRQFVYSYVLEERPVNVEVMRDNLLQYHEYLQLVGETKKKLQVLAEIEGCYQEILKNRQRVDIQQYLILRAGVELCRTDLSANSSGQQQIAAEMAGTAAKLQTLAEGERELKQQERSYRDSLAADSTFQLVERLQEEIARLAGERVKLEQKLALFAQELDQELDQLKLLPERGEGWLNPYEKKRVAQLEQTLAGVLKGQLPEQGFWQLQQDFFAQLADRLSGDTRQVENNLESAKARTAELREELKTLKSGRFVYDRQVTELQSLIQREIKVRPDIFCELLEVKSEKWRNAVEGFLNTQRFDLIMEPRFFDRALAVYERYKREHDLHGVGLVNTARVLKHLNRVEPGTLAAEVEAQNDYARGYLNQLMGRLIKCDSEQELKNYPQSITPSCMTYRNNTARQINFRVYQVPFIGSAARLRQVELKEKELAELLQQIETLEGQCRKLGTLRKLLQPRQGAYARLEQQTGLLAEREELQHKLAARTEELKGIDTSGIDNLKQQLAKVEQQLEKLKAEVQGLLRRQGSLETTQENLQAQARELEHSLEEAGLQLEEFCSVHPEAAEEGAARYPREASRLDPSRIVENFSSNRKGLETTIAGQQRQLESLQVSFNSAFHFGAAVSAGEIDSYLEEKQRLENSELPLYEEKIEAARKQAEEEFKEHFIYKLKENIDNARTEFNFLNEALKEVSFGSDRYRFQVTPAESYREFYQMLMDTDLVQGGVSLFEGQFWDRHREAMDLLLDRILSSSQSMDQELAAYVDYRSYLEYDIKIFQDSGEYALLSQVAREKSGGETQTPYYVAILASFLQLYRVKTNQDSIRLVLFDEAFNRMDSDRIENSLKFIKQLGLQVILGAPTEKCEYIAPHLSTTLLVLRDGADSWVEDYHQLKLQWGLA